MDIKTINTYNILAKEYDDETADFWDKFPQDFFYEFIKLVQGRVLDVGSGPGRDGLILKGKGLDVVCLDASEAMVKMSSEKGLESVLGDFNNLPFAGEFFGGVWAYTSLLHVPKSEVEKSIKEIYRVLNSEGILGLGLIEGNTEGYRESSGVGMPRWFSFYTKEEVEILLKNNGFEILHFDFFKPGSRNYLNFIVRKI